MFDHTHSDIRLAKPRLGINKISKIERELPANWI